MLRQIVLDAVAEHADLQVVEERLSREGLLRAARKQAADVVILNAREADDMTLCNELLLASPTMCVLVLSSTGQALTIYELLPRRTVLADVSPRSLMDAVRTCSVRRRRGDALPLLPPAVQ